MLRQIEILNEFAQMAFDASKGDFDELVLVVKSVAEDGVSSAECRQVTDGEVETLSLYDVEGMDNMGPLCEELHEELKSHTGGELEKFTITIDADGTAKTKIQYRGGPKRSIFDI